MIVLLNKIKYLREYFSWPYLLIIENKFIFTKNGGVHVEYSFPLIVLREDDLSFGVLNLQTGWVKKEWENDIRICT